MPRRKKPKEPTFKTFKTNMRTLSEILDDLEQYREKYGECFVPSIGNTTGEIQGMTNPYCLTVRINGDKHEFIYFASRKDKYKTVT